VLVVRDSSWHGQWAPKGGVPVASLAFFEGDDYYELLVQMYELVHLTVEGS
jgi:hypothetical protein